MVTGANGYIASHVVDQFLLAGYRVRGTVRSTSKGAWMQTYFDQKYGPKLFSFCVVPDMEAPNAFDDAIKGAAGIAHVATPVLQGPNPNEIIPMVIQGTVNILQAAIKESSVKAVVLTSSSSAVTHPDPTNEVYVDENSWNEVSSEIAWAPPPYEGFERTIHVYCASKAEAEKAAWKFMREQNPHFVLNTVLPNVCIGKILSPENQGYTSSAGWIAAVWNGFKDAEDVRHIPPQHYVNVQDVARLHVASVLDNDVQNERLLAYVQSFNWNIVLAAFRKMYPQRIFVDDLVPDPGQDLTQPSTGRSEGLLKRFNKSGWTPLEESLKDNVESLVK